MSNLEHYFENLLFDGKDCRGDVNKSTLTKEEQEAVEICAQYVIWSIFDGREEFKNFIKQEFEPIKHAHWIHEHLASTSGGSYAIVRCSNCLSQYPMTEENYCPHCGARMDGGEND